MSFILDLILIAIFLLCAFLGRKKGAASTLLSLVSGISALFLSLFLAGPLGAAIRENILEKTLERELSEPAAFALSLLILFVFFWVLFRILARAARLLNRIPILGTLNQTAGLILGLLQGLLLTLCLCELFRLALPALAREGGLLYGFDEGKTLLYRLLVHLNPLSLISEWLMF